MTIIEGTNVGQNSRMTIIEGTDTSQNARMTIIDGVNASQNVRIDFSNTAITIIQGVDTTQNTRLTVSEGVDLSQNVRIDYSNTALTIAQGVDNSQNVRIDFSNTRMTIIEGVDAGQNSRMIIIEGTDTSQNARMAIIESTNASQNVRIDYSNTALTIAQGVDNSQNVRIDYSNTAITIIQGVDTTQNTNIAATDGKMSSAYNTANNAVANIGPVITTNSVATVIIANTTASTSNATGALRVSGGVGILGNVTIGTTSINSDRTITNYGVTTNALGSGSGSRTIDITLGNFVTATATGITTWTFSNPVSSPNACGFILELVNGGSATQTWPATVRWPGGTAPTLTASGTDILVFITDDAGANWRGVASMLDSK
jgi:hypothetical protein